MMITAVFITLVLLMLLRVPVAFCIAAAAGLYLLMGGADLSLLPQRMVGQMTSIPLMAIPFFILAGELMNVGGITDRIFAFARALVGRLPGSLGHANVVASMVFSGMSGSAVADTAGLGRVELKAMRDNGYPDDFSVGVTVSSSTIGPILPPSINIIIFASITGTSIGGLFVGAIIPGVVMGLSLMALVAIIAARRELGQRHRSTLREFGEAAVRAVLPMLTPAIILGAILLGVATPTEAAVIAVVYALVLGLLVFRVLRWRDLVAIAMRTTILTSALMLIIAFATPLGHALARERVPQRISEALFSVSTNLIVVWLLVLVFLLIVGTFMEVAAALIVLTPIIAPAMVELGADPLQVGVVMVLGLGLGLITPPVGLCLYVGSQISGLGLERVIQGTAPFYAPILVTLVLTAALPALTTWLPRAVGL
ncbi:TRAP transporter large permease [Ornithinicoccus halotolerans]|uniref:TRAP transporter large permease n=1 Tax=Ornithinicoccus halotolerans TaxID=1748220 RepID=UPI0012965F1E|nr:TRAP transporter large permease [Ornithinicoccus halotolerans]